MMKRRALSLALALVLLICMIPASVFAAQTMETSDTCVSVIKFFEGYHKYPYWDNSQYTVGYGTRCPDNKLAYYKKYGITKSEATTLLNKYINTFEDYVNEFAQENGLKLTQSQFDALVSFTFNVGPGWMNETDSLMTQAVLNGEQDNDFLFAITMWCVSGNSIATGLIDRRLVEANMYLYGDYSTAVPDYLSYVRFNYTDSTYEGDDRTITVQGYNAALTDEVRSVPERSGYRFLGWYTATSGGKWVSHLDSTTKGIKLYARWQAGKGNVVNGVIQGTKASYKRVTDSSVHVYAKPSTTSTYKYTLSANTTVSIVADYVTSGGTKWGKLSDGCWLKLGGTSPILTPADSAFGSGILVTVTNSRMNVRSGPGTGYPLVRYAYKGEQMLITEVRDVSGTKWGKFSGGWICLDYTDYNGKNDSVIATGTVSSSTGSLNIRSGPGTGYGKVGTLASGDRVEIYEITTSGGVKWGRISKGWISLDYVKLDSDKEETPEQVIATGTVSSSTGSLNIRAGAGTGYSKVGTLASGDRVEIYEIVTVSGTQWGRISKGWISLSYVKLDTEDTGTNETLTGVVNTKTVDLKVRSGPGTGYSIVTTLPKGTTVTIYETKTVSGTQWGRIDKGWICMDYIKLTDGSSSGSDNGSTGSQETTVETGTRTGTVVNCTTLNVRSDAGTGYTKVGTVDKGSKITLTDLKRVNGTVWGKISSGWVSLDYVDLDEIAAGSLAMVDNSFLNIRSGAGTSYDKTGTYYKGDVVIILQVKQAGSVTWGQTDKGWISLEYVM